ncbi:putative transcription factor [Cladorrhinum sp. PSN332]|nr:putative transcription factor [Cladorrhinum sp. PSN332]
MSNLEPPTDPTGAASSAGHSPETPSTPASLTPTPFPPPGRRTHKKSRTGCATCKARKIKCDERHPSCLNCISHGVECPFLNPASVPPQPPRPQAPRKSKSKSPISPDPPPPLPRVETDELPLLELELLHNFTTRTYSTLAADPSICEFWRVSVVDLGLQCDYIMRAVLALSALHLAYHRPERRDYYTAQGILLHQKASRAAMSFMTPEVKKDKDASASLFLFSMLTVYFALASPRHSHPDGSLFITETSPSFNFPDWTFLVTGAKSLSRVLGERGHETMLAPFLAYGKARWHAHRAKLAEAQNGDHFPLTHLRQQLVASMSHSPEDQEILGTYLHALDELELTLVARQDPEMPRDVLDAMLWLWEVSHSLVPLLKAGKGGEQGPRQEAVAIFAHFCILLKHHESTWWLQGWAEHLVMRAHDILDEERREWIEWPVRVVGLAGSSPNSMMGM